MPRDGAAVAHAADEFEFCPPEPSTCSSVAEWQPEHALLEAVLHEAIECLAGRGGVGSACSAADRARKRERLRCEAEGWVRSDARTPVTAFVAVCEALGLDSEATRAVLLRGLRRCEGETSPSAAQRSPSTLRCKSVAQTPLRRAYEPGSLNWPQPACESRTRSNGKA